VLLKTMILTDCILKLVGQSVGQSVNRSVSWSVSQSFIWVTQTDELATPEEVLDKTRQCKHVGTIIVENCCCD